MKLLAIGLVLLGCTLGGIWLDEDQKKRIEELEKFIYLFELLKAEIDYRLTPLREACLIVGKKTNHKGIEGVMINFAKSLEDKESVSVEEMWEQAINAKKSAFHLQEEDYKLLYDFGGACGYLDKNMEKRNIEMVLDQLITKSKEAKVKYQKTSKLSRSLGVLVGLGLSIFLL